VNVKAGFPEGIFAIYNQTSSFAFDSYRSIVTSYLVVIIEILDFISILYQSMISRMIRMDFDDLIQF